MSCSAVGKRHAINVIKLPRFKDNYLSGEGSGGDRSGCQRAGGKQGFEEATSSSEKNKKLSVDANLQLKTTDDAN